jgi:hypothetical protein
MRRYPLPSPALVVALVALVAAAGGFAMAAVPDSQGRIVACYATKGGGLRVLAKGTKCRRGEKLLRWSQTGPAGPAGQPGQPGATGGQGPTGSKGTDGTSGSSAATMLTGNTSNVVANSGATHYLHPSGTSDVFGAPTFAEMLSPERTIVARDLAVRLGNPPEAGQTYVITFEVDAADTPLTCSITGTAEVACGDSSHSVSVPPRSRISLKVEVGAGATGRRVLFGWRAVDGG